MSKPNLLFALRSSIHEEYVSKDIGGSVDMAMTDFYEELVLNRFALKYM